jgi:hypothetical protein
MKDMHIEIYKNPEGKKFPYYEKYLANSKNDRIVLFKTHNTFFTFSRGGEKNVLYRAYSIPNTKSEYYEIHIPNSFDKSNKSRTLNIEITLNKNTPNSFDLFYGGKNIKNFKREGYKIKFNTNDNASPNQITLIDNETKKYIPIEKIEVFSSFFKKELRNIITQKKPSVLRLSTNFTPCNFEFKSQSNEIYLSLGSHRSININTFRHLSEILPNIILNYWSFDTNKETQISRFNIEFAENFNGEIECF